MVFTQPVKLGVVGEEGQRRLEIPVWWKMSVQLVYSTGDLRAS